MNKKTELIEIKKDKTGTGLLIENDGFVQLNKETINEDVKDNKWNCPYPFIVDAVFQNSTLKMPTEEYIQKKF